MGNAAGGPASARAPQRSSATERNDRLRKWHPDGLAPPPSANSRHDAPVSSARLAPWWCRRPPDTGLLYLLAFLFMPFSVIG